MTLPFLGLIMSIMQHERVQIPHGFPVMKREDQISGQTMMRSKAHLCGSREEEEKAEGEDTAPEGSNTNEDINNFTLDLEDMEASPSQPQLQPQAQPQRQPHALPHAPNHINMLLDKFDYFQRSQDAMQRTLDDHYVYTTTQMTYLQEQITALSTQIRDLASDNKHL